MLWVLSHWQQSLGSLLPQFLRNPAVAQASATTTAVPMCSSRVGRSSNAMQPRRSGRRHTICSAMEDIATVNIETRDTHRMVSAAQAHNTTGTGAHVFPLRIAATTMW